MDIELFVENLSQNVFTDTPKESFGKDTEYMELEEWTSMTAFTLISYFEEKYGKKLMLPELLQASTIKDLYQLVNE